MKLWNSAACLPLLPGVVLPLVPRPPLPPDLGDLLNRNHTTHYGPKEQTTIRARRGRPILGVQVSGRRKGMHATAPVLPPHRHHNIIGEKATATAYTKGKMGRTSSGLQTCRAGGAPSRSPSGRSQTVARRPGRQQSLTVLETEETISIGSTLLLVVVAP